MVISGQNGHLRTEWQTVNDHKIKTDFCSGWQLPLTPPSHWQILILRLSRPQIPAVSVDRIKPLIVTTGSISLVTTTQLSSQVTTGSLSLVTTLQCNYHHRLHYNRTIITGYITTQLSSQVTLQQDYHHRLQHNYHHRLRYNRIIITHYNTIIINTQGS